MEWIGLSDVPLAAVRRDALDQTFEAHGPTNGKSLGDVASHLDQQVENIVLLDPLGDDLAAQRMGKADRRLYHQAVGAVVDHSFDEALVDLDLVRRNLLQVVERRKARSIIIDRDPDPQLTQ